MTYKAAYQRKDDNESHPDLNRSRRTARENEMLILWNDDT